MTWIPWNPVSKKKIVPNLLSDIEKNELLYSSYCSNENNNPSETVNIFIKINIFFFFKIIILWATVTVTPDVNKTSVFKTGVLVESNIFTIKGGQLAPISISGTKLKCWYAQNIEKKNKISDEINNTMDVLKEFSKVSILVPSLFISLFIVIHQLIEMIEIIVNLIMVLIKFWYFSKVTTDIARFRTPKDVSIGHGLLFKCTK